MSSGEEEEIDTFKKESKIAEKRLKMAKDYLAKLGDDISKNKIQGGKDLDDDSEEGNSEIDAEECDREILASRIRHDVLQAKGKRFEKVADEFSFEPDAFEMVSIRVHSQTPTCVAVTKDGSIAFTGSKAGDITKWDLNTGKKLYQIRPGLRTRTIKKTGISLPKEKRPVGHTNHVTCIAVSFDGKFVASGSLDKTINIWDGESCKHLATFTQHRGSVTGLCFRYGTYQLYSSSSDRTVKIWSLDQLAYIDTLFGHQDAVSSIHALANERCMTVGARDRTCRLWKIPEESQLIFRSSEDAGGALETVQMLTEDYFVTGSDEGTLSIWSTTKKKPFSMIHKAHENSYEEESDFHPIISLASCPFTDFFASGSDDAELRFWKASDDFKSIDSVGSIHIEGFINGISFSDDGKALVVAVGKDHRLGRWSVNKSVQNRIIIIRFK